jgi:hypothetical protein
MRRLTAFLLSPVVVLCMSLAHAPAALAQEAAVPAGPIAPADQKAVKPAPKKVVKKPKVTNPQAVPAAEPLDRFDAADPARAKPAAPSLARAPKSEDPVSVGARLSGGNARNYGLNSTTTQDDLIRRDEGSPAVTPENKIDLGVNFKF